MKKLLLLPLVIAFVGCSSNESEDAPAPKGSAPTVTAPPPGMTGPGQGGGPGGSAVDSGEGSK